MLHTFSGTIGTVFTCDRTAPDSEERFETSGTITNAAGTLALDVYSVSRYQDPHSLTRVNEFDTNFAWRVGSVSYGSNVSALVTTTQSSDILTVISDVRSGSDWGGAGTKSATSTNSITKLGDGQYSSAFSYSRSFPSLLPRAGGAFGTQAGAAGSVEDVSLTFSYELDTFNGVSSGTFSSYDHLLDGSTWATMQPGQTGTLTTSQTYVNSSVQKLDVIESLPLVNANGNLFTHRTEIHTTDTKLANKVVTETNFLLYAASTSAYGFGLTIDPPLQQGVPAQPVKKKSLWDKVKGAGITTVTCVGGGYAAAASMETKHGRRALIKTVGKGLARKAVPGVGWVSTGLCAGKAVGDWFWG